MEFPALSNAGATQNFFVAITNDAIPELTESFTLSVGTNDPDAIVATEFASGFINDDDGELVYKHSVSTVDPETSYYFSPSFLSCSLSLHVPLQIPLLAYSR